MHKKIMLVLIAGVISASLLFTSGCQLITKIAQGPATVTTTTESSTPLSSTTASTLTTLIPQTSLPSISTSSAVNLPSIADVVARVKPSVVAINVTISTTNIFGQTVNEQGAGSGWVIDANGLIVTNNHVIDGAKTIEVVFADGTKSNVDPSTVAADSITDLAILKVNKTGLQALPIGNSSNEAVGDWVVAIGNALGQGIRATVGIVSRQDVTLDIDASTQVSGLIETDAAINPGNSGGPLVNLAGQVIGITSLKLTQSGVEGMGYAISMNQALPVIQQLISTGVIIYPYLGVQVQTVDATVATYYGLSISKGALLTYIDPASPAFKAGLKTGDVIVKFNGQNVDTAAALLNIIRSAKVGQSAEVDFYRGNTQMVTTAVLVQRPAQ
ncbi:MAG TPA: trypsin-like peptidase domain-containing protein [Dehalococcoidales bacterium]|nr:trypsin-like peptidase domain-containing protein [Dehalococcoidales bacterium]